MTNRRCVINRNGLRGTDCAPHGDNRQQHSMDKNKTKPTYIGCPKKNALSECCWSYSALAESPFAGTPCVLRLIFLLRLSRIKRPQVISMVKFSPIALNFGNEFVLFVHFFGTPCICMTRNIFIISVTSSEDNSDQG